MYRGREYVPKYHKLKNIVLKEMHNVPYVGHPGYPKTITIVKSQYFFPIMKKEVDDYISIYLEFQKVKLEHRNLVALLQPFPIVEWKWEVVTIDFITKLPRIVKQHDSIMVVVDKLTKVSHFIPMKLTHKATNIANIYMREIASLHGVPKKIVSDRDNKLTSNLWKELFKGFRINLNFSTTYHPKSDGQIERVNQVIDDMLRMYVMDNHQNGKIIYT
jgi:hypothetical protein